MFHRKAVIWASGLFLGAAALSLVARAAEKTFRPARTAVVDRTAVFQGYEKRKDREAELKADSKALDEKFQALEKRLKDLTSELPNFEAGQRRNEKLVEKYQIELDLKDLKEREVKRLAEKELKYSQEMADDIGSEVNSYSESLQLDMVFEKNLVAPRETQRLPLVHYVKPEFEITSEIIARLNARYRSAPPLPSAKTGG
jgi:Skp family chaperone for outer membrane proteins